ncbi:hypothetical protein C0993_006838 [Termitomyces sp. T159_Od127]|nr:hypothetical protein C0993_006838 [Termitomyces sp. T159_Od127]
MDRPGPLKDLPLDQFLPINPNHSRKRPPSPVPVLFSPAKRRILDEEGIYSPRSHLARRNAFSDVLAGPSSPAKRLDFGSPRRTPSSCGLKNLHDCFDNQASSGPFVPTLPQTDLQSIHHPGFHVYYDPPSPSSADETSCLPASSDKDKGSVVKENIPPRRKTRKAATAPLERESKAQPLSTPAQRRVSERLKAKSTPATPKKPLAGDRVQHDSPTPRRTTFGQEAAFTPRRFLGIDEETSTALIEEQMGFHF